MTLNGTPGLYQNIQEKHAPQKGHLQMKHPYTSMNVNRWKVWHTLLFVCDQVKPKDDVTLERKSWRACKRTHPQLKSLPWKGLSFCSTSEHTSCLFKPKQKKPTTKQEWSTMPAKIYQALPNIKQTPCNRNMHLLLALQKESEPMDAVYSTKGSSKAAYCRYFQRDAQKAHGKRKGIKTLPASMLKCHKGISLNNCSLIILPLTSVSSQSISRQTQSASHQFVASVYMSGERKPHIRWSPHSDEMEKRPHGRHRQSLLAAEISRMKARLPVQPSFIYKRRLHSPQWKQVLERVLSAW